MRVVRLILTWALLASTAFSTSLKTTEKEFAQIVSEADHIVIGKVVSVRMRDKNGEPVHDPNARTEPHSGNVISIWLSVGKDDVLKTGAQKVPRVITFSLWDGLVLDFRSVKELEGQSFVVLLEKDSFQPHGVAPFDFMWPLDWRDRVLKVITEQKTAPSH